MTTTSVLTGAKAAKSYFLVSVMLACLISGCGKTTPSAQSSTAPAMKDMVKDIQREVASVKKAIQDVENDKSLTNTQREKKLDSLNPEYVLRGREARIEATVSDVVSLGCINRPNQPKTDKVTYVIFFQPADEGAWYVLVTKDAAAGNLNKGASLKTTGVLKYVDCDNTGNGVMMTGAYQSDNCSEVANEFKKHTKELCLVFFADKLD